MKSEARTVRFRSGRLLAHRTFDSDSQHESFAIKLLCFCLLVLPLLSSCNGPDEVVAPTPSEVRREFVGPDYIIVYLIDTLRADHLGTYGYQRPTSPSIDALATESIVFESAYSPASWTRPSVGSLLTGLLPARHGAVRRESALRDDVATMAELLGEAGYEATGFITNPNLLPDFGFDRGFATYYDMNSISIDTDAHQIHAAALAHLAAAKGRQFLYLHSLDPHHPYAPPESFARRFDRTSGGEPLDDSMPEVVARALDLYDAEIAYADQALGDFIEELKQRGIWDRTLFVLVSDHGEEFWDHESIRHGKTLFEEQIRVPLLIRLPRATDSSPGKRIAAPVRLIDVLPSLLDEIGSPIPQNLDGASFMGLVRGEAEPEPRPICAEQNLGQLAISSLSDGNLKLIRQRAPIKQIKTLLFDLSNDPHESANIAGTRPKALAVLSKQLTDFESATQGGVYIEFVNSRARDDVHRVKARIELQRGEFRDLVQTDFESGDGTDLSADKRVLTLALELRNQANPTGERPLLLIDADRIRFRAEPPDAWMDIRLTIDGEAKESALFLMGAPDDLESVELPWRSKIGSQEILFDGTPLRPAWRSQEPYVRIFQIQAQATSAVAIDASLDARLRALGYVDDTPAEQGSQQHGDAASSPDADPLSPQ
jgi:arylsulfatase A-like enzyme